MNGASFKAKMVLDLPVTLASAEARTVFPPTCLLEQINSDSLAALESLIFLAGFARGAVRRIERLIGRLETVHDWRSK